MESSVETSAELFLFRKKFNILHNTTYCSQYKHKYFPFIGQKFKIKGVDYVEVYELKER
jgi:hypothetical protein